MMHRVVVLSVIAISLSAIDISRAADEEETLLSGHPRLSYDNVRDIDAMTAALRTSLAGHERHSFSRGWWSWDRLRARYVDDGRKDKNALRILRAVFRGLILDRHARLKAKGEGDLLYMFFTTLRGDKRESVLDVKGRKVFRDLHGGGYHGSWGSAARMRIYEELVKAGMLSKAEQTLFKQIVHQSLDGRFIDFREKHQNATNHTFGNAGGVAIALRLFPDVPQVKEARAWLNRIWIDLSDFGDWKEWTYYPYGPIFLHGLVDLTEEGKIETDRELIYAIGRRSLGFVHGGGVRGNPNSGANVNKDRPGIDPKVRPNGPDAMRSGRLIRSTLRAENHPSTTTRLRQAAAGHAGQGGDDSFGQFGFADYFGAGSAWTRQAVLTAEGCLVVRDVYESEKATDGYQAGPCWQLAGDKKPPLRAADQNWFDAPAWDHAWWQKTKKRVLLYIHPAKDQTCGQVRHQTSGDISHAIKTDNSFAKSIVKAGKPQVWLSVLMPFNEGEDAAKLANKKIKTTVDRKGNAGAKIGKVKVTIDADGTWKVKR